MQEYNDGSFGEIKEGSKLLKELSEDANEIERTRAIHFGSKEELEQMKIQGMNAKRITAKLEQLERKVNRIIVHFGIETPGEVLIVD